MSLTLQTEIDFSKLKVLDSDSLSLIVYLPLDRTNMEVNRIRLKNAIAEVKALAEERHDDPAAIKKLVGELEKLSVHDAFQHATYPGLAILTQLDEPGEISLHPLWQTPEPRVSLAAKPHLTPLIRNNSGQTVTLLCLADNRLRLFRGHYGELHPEKPPEALPASLEEVKRFEEQAGLDGNEFYRNKTRMAGGGSPHGEGPTSRIEAEFERRYFREIGQALSSYLEPGEKLMLAGVHEKLSLFKEENKELPYLSLELHGNFERTDTDELLKEANQKLAESDRALLMEELKKAEELTPKLRADDIEAIKEAALQARVDTLYLHNSSLPESEREDLALSVLRSGGRVKLLDQPDYEGKLLATLRW